MRKIVAVVVSWLVLILVTISTALAIPIVSIEPYSQDILVGQTFTVDAAISNVSNLSGWNWDLIYDPNAISFVSIAEGPFLNDSGTYSTLFSYNTIAPDTVRAS